MIYTAKFKKAILYHNIKGETPEAIKAKTGCDTILNGMLFNPDGTFCCKCRIDGKQLADEAGTFYGYGWSGNSLPTIAHSNSQSSYDNYITSVLVAEVYKRGRTAISFYDGKYTVLCVSDGKEAMTILQVENAMKQHTSQFLILDGGGSSYLDCPKGKVDTSQSRKTQNRMYICIWEDKGESPMPNERTKLVATAKKYLGTTEAAKGDDRIIDKYNRIKESSSYKMGYTDPWCAAFVSVMANEAGLSGIIPPDAYCPYLIAKIEKSGGTIKAPAMYTPIPGDIIFYDWQADGTADHVGIVEKVSGSMVTVIEGNYKDSVSSRTLPVDARYIKCYAVPNYAQKDTGGTVEPHRDTVVVDGDYGSATENAVRKFQQSVGLEADGVAGKMTLSALLEDANWSLMKRGSKGQEVRFLQACLNKKEKK